LPRTASLLVSHACTWAGTHTHRHVCIQCTYTSAYSQIHTHKHACPRTYTHAAAATHTALPATCTQLANALEGTPAASTVSLADLVVIAGAYAVQLCDGPAIEVGC